MPGYPSHGAPTSRTAYTPVHPPAAPVQSTAAKHPQGYFQQLPAIDPGPTAATHSSLRSSPLDAHLNPTNQPQNQPALALSLLLLLRVLCFSSRRDLLCLCLFSSTPELRSGETHAFALLTITKQTISTLHSSFISPIRYTPETIENKHFRQMIGETPPILSQPCSPYDRNRPAQTTDAEGAFF
jgi:hypothetical protein